MPIGELAWLIAAREITDAATWACSGRKPTMNELARFLGLDAFSVTVVRLATKVRVHGRRREMWACPG